MVTQRATIFYHRWCICFLHRINQSSIHLICPLFVNSHPYLHRTLLVITGDLIASIVTQIAMIYHHQWYLCLLHWIIQSLIHLICPWFVNSRPNIYRTPGQVRKLLQYLFGIHLVCQIPYHQRPTIMEVTIFMDEWLMCPSWYRHNNNSMP